MINKNISNSKRQNVTMDPISEEGQALEAVDTDILKVMRKVDLVRTRMRKSGFEDEEERRRTRRIEANEMIQKLGEDKMWEKFRIFKLVEKQCEMVEREVREQGRDSPISKNYS
jgi:hypothetical protein